MSGQMVEQRNCGCELLNIVTPIASQQSFLDGFLISAQIHFPLFNLRAPVG